MDKLKLATDPYFSTKNFEHLLRGYKIKQLGELSREGEIQVKIIDIVYSEILGRIRKNLIRTSTLFKQAGKTLNSEGKILKNLDEFGAYYPMPGINVEENYEKLKTKIDSFLMENNIEIISSEQASIKEVFEKYFEQKFPFGEGQKKEEFPDAFALSAIEKWSEANRKKSYVLSKDGDLINYKASNDRIIPIENLAEYLDAITRKKEEKERLVLIDKLIEENLNVVKNYIETNYEDKLAFEVFESFLKDAWYEDVEYDPATIEDIYFKTYLITDIEETKVFVEIDAEIKLNMNISYDDLSSGIYDKEDGVWYNVKYVNDNKVFHTEFKFIAEFNYEISKNKESYFEFESIVEIKLEDYEEKS